MISALFEMSRQLRGCFTGPIAIAALEALPQAAMHVAAPCGRQLLVKDLLIKSMNESVFTRHAAVRPCGDAGCGQSSGGAGETFADPLYVQQVGVHSPREQESRRTRTRGARHVEHGAFAGIKNGYLSEDHLSDVNRQGLPRPETTINEPPPVIGASECSLGDEVVGQGDDEERLSLRSIEYAIGERLRQSVRCNARREVLRNLRARQSAEGHIDAPPFDAQVAMNAENRVGASRDLRLSIGGKDEE